MASYLRFAAGEGEVLMEVDEGDAAEALSETGEQNAGLRQWARDQAGEVVAVARSGFEDAVRQAVRLNVPAFLAAAEALEKPPAEMQITFGLKGTGEMGKADTPLTSTTRLSGPTSARCHRLQRPESCRRG